MEAVLDTVTLSYEVYGQGEPLILLHGNGEDHTVFTQWIPLLAKQFTVYALDSRNHGHSSHGLPMQYEIMADDVIAFIQQLQLKKPLLCGFSDGAIIGLMIAIKAPELLQKLVSCGANIQPSGLKGYAMLIMKLGYFFNRSPYLRLMIEEPHISLQSLARLSLPVLILAGKHDLVRENETRRIAASIPHASLHILAKENHGSYLAHDKTVKDIILPFLMNS